MVIQIPTNFLTEREYIVKVLIGDFLGLKYRIEKNSNISDYIILLSNSKKIIIKDAFFSSIESDTYLNQKHIPKSVTFEKNKFLDLDNVAILFGTNKLIEEENKIIYENDIFAASFFMLTRWEEYVISEKDKYGRFPEEKSLAIKCNFNSRPIVNEYTEIIWNMLISLGFEQKRCIRKYQLKITHDVDFFRKFDTPFKFLKAFLGDIIMRKDLKKALNTINLYTKILLKKANDPYDVFDFLMAVSEKNGLKSHFYFIPSLKDKFSSYSIDNQKVKSKIEQIVKRKHIIGYHTSWQAAENEHLFENEINKLRSISKNVKEGRLHYLRLNVPRTWQTWQKFELEEDSTLGFSKTIGFRAGTCYKYQVFDILSKKELTIFENPLIAMDTALKAKYKDDYNKIIRELIEISEVIKKYKGNFVLLWHNNNINCNFGENFNSNYEYLIQALK